MKCLPDTKSRPAVVLNLVSNCGNARRTNPCELVDLTCASTCLVTKSAWEQNESIASINTRLQDFEKRKERRARGESWYEWAGGHLGDKASQRT